MSPQRHSDHTVTIQIAPSGGNLDWQPGEFILVKLRFACETSPTEPSPIDPCCPPWNKNLLQNMMFYQGSGSISAPYTLKFQPTTAFNNQMLAYINYLHSNPAITAITIDWRLHDQGNGTIPSPPYGPQIGPTVYTTWNWNATNPVFSNPGFFAGFPMQVGTWYMIHTGIYLENGQKFFPDKCGNNEIFVRVQVMNAKTGGEPVLEFSDGKNVIKTLPIRNEGRRN